MFYWNGMRGLEDDLIDQLITHIEWLWENNPPCCYQ